MASISQRYREALTHARRVAGGYKRYGADFGGLLKEVARPTEASIRRLQEGGDIMRKIRAEGDRAVIQSQREEEREEKRMLAEIVKNNFISSLRTGVRGGAMAQTMMDRSIMFVSRKLDEILSDIEKDISSRAIRLYDIFIKALEDESGEIYRTLQRLAYAAYDKELNDIHEDSEKNNEKYISLFNRVLMRLSFSKSVNLSELPWNVNF